jgi:hypothetical protein
MTIFDSLKAVPKNLAELLQSTMTKEQRGTVFHRGVTFRVLDGSIVDVTIAPTLDEAELSKVQRSPVRHFVIGQDGTSKRNNYRAVVFEGSMNDMQSPLISVNRNPSGRARGRTPQMRVR